MECERKMVPGRPLLVSASRWGEEFELYFLGEEHPLPGVSGVREVGVVRWGEGGNEPMGGVLSNPLDWGLGGESKRHQKIIREDRKRQEE